MTKTPEIVSLFERVRQQLPELTLAGHWNADLAAIGFVHPSSPNRLVYVCTHGKKPGRYDFELEGDVAHPGGQDIDYVALLSVIEKHLCSHAEFSDESVT